MKKNILVILVATTILLILSAWIANTVYTQFSSYQTQIDKLQTQNSELQSQIGQLQNQTNALQDQNSKMITQMGDLTKQLALERHIRIEIVSLSHDVEWYPFGGVTVEYGFNATIRNNDVLTVSGLALTVKTYYGLSEIGTGTPIPYEINLLNVGEEREVRGIVLMPLDSPKNLTYVATLKSADRILDTFTLPP